jgi:hypothetical protein
VVDIRIELPVDVPIDPSRNIRFEEFRIPMAQTQDPQGALGISSDAIQLPAQLVEAIRSHRCVLFLGAGASSEARDPNGNAPPLGVDLRNILSQKFFGKVLADHDLMTVAEMAMSAAGDSTVFDYIRTVFEPFMPSPGHILIPTFRWRALATTNYDLLVERAYGRSPDRLQSLVPFVKDSEPIEERLQSAPNPLCLFKLHGCLDHVHDASIPIVLSHEHYDRHASGRTRLFNRVTDLANESPFIFCGYSLGDAHIRTLLYKF